MEKDIITINFFRRKLLFSVAHLAVIVWNEARHEKLSNAYILLGSIEIEYRNTRF